MFLGGHSLGGILAALYAGYDFGRVPGPEPIATDDKGTAPASPDAGDRDIAGLVLLDGAPLSVIPRLSSTQYLEGIHIPLLPDIPGVRQLLGSSAGTSARSRTSTASRIRRTASCSTW